MTTLQNVYMMAFTPEKMEDKMLISICQMAADRLAAKNPAFAERMGQLNKETRINFSNQLFAANMHTPQTMEMTLKGWLQNSNVPASELRFGDNFFPHALRDPQGRENYFLYYFDFR